jgi:hypothetical protein
MKKWDQTESILEFFFLLIFFQNNSIFFINSVMHE